MGRKTIADVPGWMRALGLDSALRRAAVGRLAAQTHIARIRNGAIAHHAPVAPVVLDASLDPLPNFHPLTRAFPRALLGVTAEEETAQLGFAAFGLDRSADEFAACLQPGAAFAVVAAEDLSALAAELQAVGLVVTARRHWAGLGHSLAGRKPVAEGGDAA